MVKQYMHNNGKFGIKVDTRKGKPIVDKRGFIHLVNEGGYNGCNAITEKEFEENFTNDYT